MIHHKNIQVGIATALQAIGNKKYLEKATILLQKSTSKHALHLRDLDLNASNITTIVSCLKQEKERNNSLIQSISFSYNHGLGDVGTISLMKNLPSSIREIGLVNCGISDVGGVEILHCLNNLPNLQMICMEQNNYSVKFRLALEKFRVSCPRVFVVA